ncbi:MAG: PAS domain S-box protein [Candidatus Sabulitectum sp.]|nr:PAS domain S-box protein [Candidatus Sabulitectum sp.]
MRDDLKTKAQLIQEIEQLRDRINKLETVSNSNSDQREHSDQILEDNTALLKSSQSLAHIGSWEHDLITGDLVWSDEVYRIFGEEPQAFKATYEAFLEFIHPEDRALVNEAYTSSIRDGHDSYHVEHRIIRRKSGETRIVHEQCEHHRDSSGNISRSIGFVEDVTERKAVELKLYESERMYRLVTENSIYGMYRVSADGNMIFANQAFSDLTGYSQMELEGLPKSKLFPHGEAKDISDANLVLLQSGKSISGRNTLTRIDGSPVEVHFSSVPLFDNSGCYSGFIGSVMDLTERLEAEKALWESRENYRSLVESTADWVWAIDLEGSHTFSNGSIKALLGYEVNEVLGESAFPLMHPDDLESGRELVVNAVKRKSGWSNVEIRWLHKDGSVRVFESSARPLFDLNGEMTGFTGIDRDITEHKKAQEALLKSEFDMRTLFNAMTDIVFEMDYDGTYINIAPTSPELMFLSAENSIGRTLHQVFPKTEADQFLYFIRRCIDGNESITIEYPLAIGGRTVWFEGRATPKTKNTVLYIATDITDRKEAQIERERLMMAIEQAAETIVITDLNGTIEYVNPAFEKITGYSRDEVIGQNPSILKSGKQDDTFFKEIWETITSGRNWTGRIINKKKDGSFYTEEATISPVRNPSGEIINYVAVKRDITVEVKLEEQLRQAQKMEAVGQLAGGVAHDFNNLLQVINGYTELVLAEINKEHSAYEFIKEIAKAGDRAQSLVSQLLSFSRRQIINPVDLDLNEVTEKLMKMIRRVIGEHIQCEFIPGYELGTIKADSGQMEQILMNLCVNSRDALAGGGSISIETGNVLIDAEYARIHPWAKPGRYVLLSVTDDGCGMDKKTLAGIFDPFFTTKSIGKGTGLGMSTVYGIVKQHNGEIQVYTEPGKGTVIKIYLPVVARRAASIANQLDAPVLGGRETILVAEDDDMVRNLTRQTLIMAGYTVIDAKNGNDALSLFFKHADKINLLILDVVMPGLGGKEVYDKVLETHPDVPTLFCSGYSRKAIHAGFVLDSNLYFIQKPYSSDSLLRKIREVLDT